MFMICYRNEVDQPLWEVVDGEDAMQEFVSDLTNRGLDHPFVFRMEDEIDEQD